MSGNGSVTRCVLSSNCSNGQRLDLHAGSPDFMDPREYCLTAAVECPP